MTTPSLQQLYDTREAPIREVLGRVVPAAEVDGVAAAARAEFVRICGEMPYSGRRDHIMFEPSFSVFQWLAVYQAVRERGVDAHQLGREILAQPAPPQDTGLSQEAVVRIVAEAEESQRAAAPNEFVFEIVAGDAQTDFGMNIHSCAVCHAYGRHDAMDLVPYMCATDDIASDASQMGLRRTGTIALGAHHCDFRYKQGGEPKPLAAVYPEKIRVES